MAGSKKVGGPDKTPELKIWKSKLTLLIEEDRVCFLKVELCKIGCNLTYPSTPLRVKSYATY